MLIDVVVTAETTKIRSDCMWRCLIVRMQIVANQM